MIVPVRVSVPVVRMAVIVFDGLDARSYRHFRDRLRIELGADQQHQGGAEQRKQRYQPDLIE